VSWTLFWQIIGLMAAATVGVALVINEWKSK
jgi:hypothetical protein